VRALTISLLAAATVAAAAPVAGAALPDPVEAGRYALDRSLVLATPPLTTASPVIAAGGVREGGLSALQVVPGTGNRRFVSVSDRGPNGQPDAATGGRTFLAPAFAPIVYELEAQPDGRLAVLSRTQIRVPGTDPRRTADPLFAGDDSLITGIRNVVTAGLDDRTWRMSDDTHVAEYLPTDPYGLDTEGIARDPRDGSYWIGEEYRPSIAHVDRHGVMRERIVPIGAGALDTGAGPLSGFYDDPDEPALGELLPAEYKARRGNRGLEGLASNPDGTRLYAIMQSPLDTRGFSAQGYGTQCLGSSDAGTGSPNSTNWWRDVRIVELDISDPDDPRLTGEWLYRLEQLSTTDAATQGKLRISDLAWSGPRRLLVAEHDDDNPLPKPGRKVFEIDLAGATNVATAADYDTFAERAASATVLGKTQALGCFLDNGSAAELAALPTPVAPAAKSLYLDLSGTASGVGFLFDKVEGLALLDGVPGVAVANDNDFGFVQDTATNLIDVSANPGSELRIYTTRPSVGSTPAVAGTPKAGRTLTCTPGAFTGTGALELAYEWLRGGVPIMGASGDTLTLSTEDVGWPIACRVTATRVAGAVRATSLPARSADVGPVANFDTGPQGPPGPAGPRGPAGPLPRVSCKLVTKKVRGRRKQEIVCRVSAARAVARVAARAHGRTVASARVHRGVARLVLPRSLRRVTLVALDRRGKVLGRVAVATR
jgi:hypothetical protein